MSLQKAVEAAKIEMGEVAELLVDKGYTSNDFKLILSKLILDEIEYIELQHKEAE